jgi:DNA-binding TFAR19-related protein (PDSD5 family)
MQEDKKLSYHSGRATNMVQWKRDAAEYLAKSKDLSIYSKIIRSNTIPEELTTPYKVTNDLGKTDPITLKIMEDEALAHEKERRHFSKTKSMFISTILQDCLTSTSRNRLDAIALAELEEIKSNEDIIKLMQVIEKTHLYQGKEVTQRDVLQLTNMKTSFTYNPGETIQEYAARFTNMCSYLQGTEAKFKDEEEKVFIFIASLTTYSLSTVLRDTVVTWIADKSYPKSYSETYTK